jgi:hypothetical protein
MWTLQCLPGIYLVLFGISSLEGRVDVYIFGGLRIAGLCGRYAGKKKEKKKLAAPGFDPGTSGL